MNTTKETCPGLVIRGLLFVSVKRIAALESVFSMPLLPPFLLNGDFIGN